MKVIISHDIDHITVWEHTRDFVIPKFFIRSCIEFACKTISASEVRERMKSVIRNRWNNLDELMKFNKVNNIPATFFIGVSKGKGLNYSLQDACYWMKEILHNGFDVGVHGIAYGDFNEIKKEHDRFKKATEMNEFGIRMHYLRTNENTLEIVDEAGYLFDSSVFQEKGPFKVGKLWEFPLHIMDGYIFLQDSRWQNRNLAQSKDETKKTMETMFKKGIDYFTILFHDRYFNDAFCTWKKWYMWLIQYLRDNKIEIVNYRHSIKELEECSYKE